MAGRFLASGEKLICIPAMAAEYTPRGSLRSLWRQYLEYGEYREKTAVRHPHTMRRSHLFAPSLVLTLPAAAIAPRPLRKLARLSLLTYVAALLAASARAFKESERPEDAALVPVVLATMHLAHGAGSYRGAVRYGLPLSSLASVAGLAQLSRRLRPGPTPVFAPSLSDDSSAAGKRPHLPLDPLGPPARREPMRPITNPTQPATSTLARLSGSAGRVTTRSLGRDI